MTQKSQPKASKRARKSESQSPSQSQSRDSGGQTRSRTQKKYHKSAPKRSRRPIDKSFLIQERQLRPQDVPIAKALFINTWIECGKIWLAAQSVGIGRRTFYDWMVSDLEFRAEVKRARKIWRSSLVPEVEEGMRERAASKDTLAGIFILKHNTKRYREVSRVQLTGADGGPILTLDAKEELIRRLEKMLERANEKPILTAGGSEVREVAGSEGSKGLRVLRAGGSAGSQVRKARGVSYG